MKKIIIYVSIILLFLIIALFIRLDLGGQQVPVLLYHHFLSDEEMKDYDNSDQYAVSESVFENQMKYLYDNGYKTLSLKEFEDWKAGKIKIPEKSLLISIDDGLVSVFRYAKPILEKYGFNAVLFTISSRITDESIDWDPSYYQYISEDYLENDDIIEIASHSHDFHKKIDGNKAVEVLSYEEINQDLKKSKEILDTKYLAYPFNTYNKNVFKALKNNDYVLAFRGTNHKTYKNENKYMISRIVVNNDLNYLINIFEDKNYNQNIIDKMVAIIVKLKKEIIG